MPNICTNKLYLSTKDNQLRDTLIESMIDTFYCSDVQEFDNNEVFNCEMEFDSHWKFPKKEMEKLTSELPKDNDLYIRVLSHEFVNDYVGFNIYTNGEWCDKLADKY
jgi:hypothetical protein